mgnify:CR=1 FL=1
MNNSIKGEKHICSNCGAKFFDLNRKPIICPKCSTEVLEKTSNVRTRTLMPEPKGEDNNIDNSSTEQLDTVEKEIVMDDVEEDANDENDDDATSTIVNID